LKDPQAECQLIGTRTTSLAELVSNLLGIRRDLIFFVAEEQGRLRGFVQARVFPKRGEAQVTSLALMEEGANGGTRSKLLERLCQEGPKRGVKRFFAITASESAIIEAFRNAGFREYAAETAYVNRGAPEVGADEHPAIRPVQAADSAGLFALYRAITPPVIQRIEDFSISDWNLIENPFPQRSCLPISSKALEASHWIFDKDASVGGYLGTWVNRENREGYLKIMAHPDKSAAKELLKFGIARLSHSNLLICSVRNYEEYLASLVSDLGFVPGSTGQLLFREMAVRVLEPGLIPALQ